MVGIRTRKLRFHSLALKLLGAVDYFLFFFLSICPYVCLSVFLSIYKYSSVQKSSALAELLLSLPIAVSSCSAAFEGNHILVNPKHFHSFEIS